MWSEYGGDSVLVIHISLWYFFENKKERIKLRKTCYPRLFNRLIIRIFSIEGKCQAEAQKHGGVLV